MKKLFPIKYLDIVQEHLLDTTLDPYLILALIRQESAFQVNAVSVSGAIGLMQLMPKTASSESGVSVNKVKKYLYDPAFNIKIGCKHIKKLVKEFKSNIPLVLAAYNGGKKRIKAVFRSLKRKRLSRAEFIEFIPMAQSRRYVKSIYRNYNYYCMLYKGRKADIKSFLGE